MDKTPITKTPLVGSCRRFGLSRSIKRTVTSTNALISTPEASNVSTPKVTRDISPSPSAGIYTKNINEPSGMHMEQIPDFKSKSLEAKSTTSRKKCLSLSKHRKEKLLKKKIDFTRTMDSEQCITPSPDSQQKMVISQNSSSIEMELTKDHSEHVNKLKNLITIWRNGLINGLNILSSKTDPPTEVEDICKELNIPFHFIFE